MSRLPSFSSVSSGVTQILQQVLIPQAQTSVAGWSLRSVLSNIGEAHIGTLYASNLIASNISASPVIGNRATGVAIAGDGSDQGSYTCNSIAGFGTDVLGLNTAVPRGTMSNLVLMGRGVASLASNVNTSVLLGTYTGTEASNLTGTVAVGDQAAYTATGSDNVYLGTKSGYYVAGSGNVFIGANVGPTMTTAIGNTFLLGNSSNGTPLLQGDFANGRLGVNVTGAPTTTLEVNGTSWIRGSLGVNTASQLPGATLDVSGSTRIRGDVVIDGDLTVSGGPIGSDVCTGQVVIGIGATSSNYPSLISRIGGLQVCNGYLQLNRTETPFQYHLDVSGTARITGSNLIGGVTLSSTNVYTTGFISVSGRITNLSTTSNSIGGVTLSGTNLFTTGLIDVSGRITNPSTTSNSIGGLLLSNGELGAYNTNVIRTVFLDGNTSNGGRLILKNDTNQNGVSLWGATDSSGGQIQLANSSGTPTFTVFGSTGRISNASNSFNTIGGVTLSSGYIRITGTDGNNRAQLAKQTDESGQLLLYTSGGSESIGLYGNTGRISNFSSSSNSIGGVVLSNGTFGLYTGTVSGLFASIAGGNGQLSLHNLNGNMGIRMNGGEDGGGGGKFEVLANGVRRFEVLGATGNISNGVGTANRIGGVFLGDGNLELYDTITPTQKTVQLSRKDDTNNGGGIRLYHPDTGNEMVRIYTPNKAGAVELRRANNVSMFTADANVEKVELCNAAGVATIQMFPNTGDISLGLSSSRITRRVDSGSGSVNLLKYLVLGVGVDRDPQGNDTPRGNLTWTGINDYATDIYLQTAGTVEYLSVYPRVAIEIYSTKDATGACNVYSNLDARSNVIIDIGGVYNRIESYKAYFI